MGGEGRWLLSGAAGEFNGKQGHRAKGSDADRHCGFLQLGGRASWRPFHRIMMAVAQRRKCRMPMISMHQTYERRLRAWVAAVCAFPLPPASASLAAAGRQMTQRCRPDRSGKSRWSMHGLGTLQSQDYPPRVVAGIQRGECRQCPAILPNALTHRNVQLLRTKRTPAFAGATWIGTGRSLESCGKIAD